MSPQSKVSGASMKFWLCAIFLVALAWRLAFLKGGLAFVDVDLFGDEGNYFALAKGLLEMGTFVDRWPWTRPPLYPAFLAVMLSFSGYDLGPVFVAQALMGAVSSVLVALLAANEWGPRAGTVAGMLAALDPTAPLQSQYLFSEGPSAPFGLAGVLLLLKALKTGKTPWFLLSGMVLALGCLVRVTLLPMALAFVLWLVLRQIRRAQLPHWGAALLLGLVLVLLPWTLRNWREYQLPVLVDTTLGVNLYQYNSDLSRREVYNDLLKIPNPAERQVYGIRKAVEWIVSHPGEFALRAIGRLRSSWTADRYAEWYISLRTKFPEAPSWVGAIYAAGGTVWYLTIVVLTALGIGLAKGSPYRTLVLLMVGAYLGITLFIESAFRYKLGMVPYLFPMAAVTATKFRWRRDLAAHGAPALLVVWLSLPLVWPALPRDLYAHWIYFLGRARELTGQWAEAELLYRQASAIEEQPDFYIGLARSLAAQGDTSGGETTLLEAHNEWEEDPRPVAWLTHLARMRGVPSPKAGLAYPSAMAALRWSWSHLPLEPRSVLNVGEDDLGYISGVYAPEADEELHRWTSDRAKIRLWAPARSFAVRIRCTSGPFEPTAFRVLVSGAPVAVLRAPQREWADVTAIVSGGFAAGSLVEIELVPEKVHQLGNDGRRLGIVISRVELLAGP